MMERKMFYGASPDLFAKAKMLRQNMTRAEKNLWEELKENKLGVRIKPQHPIDIYIADFYCHELKLVIEIDGDSHNMQREYDEGRTEQMKEYGITTIRFLNSDILENFQNVLSEILEIIKKLKEKPGSN